MKKLLLIAIPVLLFSALYAKSEAEKIDVSVHQVRWKSGALLITLEVKNPTYIPLYADNLYIAARYNGLTLADSLIGKATYVPVQSSVLVDAEVILDLKNITVSVLQLLMGGQRLIDISGWAQIGPAKLPFSTQINLANVQNSTV